MLAENTWGKGFASELIGGFVDWCRGKDNISSLAGGVEAGNAASRRVLEKSGFRPVEAEGGAFRDAQLFQLKLR